MPLLTKCPELKPQESVWQFTRDNWLSNHVFASYDAIVSAWNISQPFAELRLRS